MIEVPEGERVRARLHLSPVVKTRRGTVPLWPKTLDVGLAKKGE